MRRELQRWGIMRAAGRERTTVAARNDAVAAQRLVFYRRLVAGNRPELTQVWFAAAVLAPYRTRPGYKLFRSDTMGMLQGPQWRLDFGIAADDTLLHLSVAALRDQLPERERDHWLGHLHTPPVSRAYLVTQLTRGACLGDGEIRVWE